MLDFFGPDPSKTWEKSTNATLCSLSGNIDGITDQVVSNQPITGGVIPGIENLENLTGNADDSWILGKSENALQSREDLGLENYHSTSSVDALTGESLSNSNDGNLRIAPIVEQAVRSAQDYLSGLATGHDFNAKMNLPFGNSWNADVANTLVKAFANGDFSQLPSIEILPSAAINGANGAFASVTNTIYLAKEFVEQNAGNLGAITSVVLEETGHFIDSKVNVSDAAGDEGDIFARVVQGKAISGGELRDLKGEDDRANINLGGENISIEMSQIAMASLNGRLYESHRGTDNQIYTRSSTDGVNWTSWNNNGGGSTPNAPAMVAFNGRLYQSHRGFDANKIYTRSSTDGVNWTGWAESGGNTPSAPALAALNGRLYQSHRGFDANKIYTRSSTDGVNWTGWAESGGGTPSAPALAALNGRLYQSHRGFDANKIYTRSSTDGVNWTGWAESGGNTPSTPAIAAFNGRIYEAHRGFDNNKIYTRSSTDGVNWTSWAEIGRNTPSAPSMTAFNGKLYLSHQGLDNKIYTSSSTNGVNWTTWNEAGGSTTSDSDDSPISPSDGAGNSISSANNIGTLSSTRTFSDFVGTADTNDYYRFNLSNNSNFSLTLNGLSGDADVQLLDSNGNQIQASTNGGTTADTISRTLNAGTYYARVYPMSGVNTNYNLNLTATAISSGSARLVRFGDLSGSDRNLPGTVFPSSYGSPFAQISNTTPERWSGDPGQQARYIQDSEMLVVADARFRSPDQIRQVIDYFNVEDLQNRRYVGVGSRTHCDLFAGDVMRALRAPLPQWDGTRELDAVGMFNWLNNSANGWRKVSSTEAADAAGRGTPAVASRPDHIAVVRPPQSGDDRNNPRIAQAGARNLANTTVRDGFGTTSGISYFVYS